MSGKEGENFVVLVGRLMYANLKTVGENNNSLFNAKMAVPTLNGDGKAQYIKISAWGSIAEGLATIPTDKFVRINGHIEERSYDGKCRHCGGPDKKFWTNVVVDNYRLED